MTQTKKPTWPLYAIFGLFALPALLAAIWYATGLPTYSKVHASLINPPKRIPAKTLHQALYEPRLPHYHGKWTLVYLTNEGCGYHCQGIEHLMDRLVRAQGENSNRIQTQTIIVQKTGVQKTRVLNKIKVMVRKAVLRSRTCQSCLP